jgi:quercetin dioxygenase-like cupin family protein
MRYPAIVRAVSAAVCATAVLGVAIAQDKAKPAAAKDAKPAAAPAAPMKDDKAAGPQHTVYNQSDLKWGDAPPSLPKGAKVAVLTGDPGKAGGFALMAKFPAGYTVPPHFHSQDENVTVISGNLMMGTGDKADAKAAHSVKAGGYSFMPAKTHHYAIAKGETVIEVSGQGPFEVTYINPADDPRKAAPAAAPKKEEKKEEKKK